MSGLAARMGATGRGACIEPKANGPVATVLSRLTLLDSTASLQEVHPCNPSTSGVEARDQGLGSF